MEPLQVVGAVGSVGLGVLVMGRVLLFLVGDRGAFKQRDLAIADLRKDVATLTAKIDLLEAELAEQRSQKHRVAGDLAKTVLALDLVRRLARECTCKVLSPLDEIIDKLVAELSTIHHRRTGDAHP